MLFAIPGKWAHIATKIFLVFGRVGPSFCRKWRGKTEKLENFLIFFVSRQKKEHDSILIAQYGTVRVQSKFSFETVIKMKTCCFLFALKGFLK